MYEIFEELLQRFNVTAYQVSKATGISQSTLSNWKARGNLIRPDKAQKIADYFGVSVEYLMTGKETASGYYLNEDTSKLAQEMYEDPDMRSLFDMKRKMSADRFSAHVKFMKELYEKENPSD